MKEKSYYITEQQSNYHVTQLSLSEYIKRVSNHREQDEITYSMSAACQTIYYCYRYHGIYNWTVVGCND